MTKVAQKAAEFDWGTVPEDERPWWWNLVDGPSGAKAYSEHLAYERYKADRVRLEPTKPFREVTDEGDVVYNFHPAQTRIMNCPKRFIVALAGRQGAKTSVAEPWLLEEMIAQGPGLYMAVAPSFPILFDSLYPKIVDLFENILKLGTTRSNPLSFIVSLEGEKILFAGTEWEELAGSGRLPRTTIRFCHAQSAASLEAKTAKACVFDEAGQEEIKPAAMEAIEGRLTTTQGRCLLTTTPYAYTWLYRRFYLPWEEARNKARKRGDKNPERAHPDIEVIQWKSYINPAFPRAEYERLKKTMPKWRHAMFYDGEFTRPAGQIYDVFQEGLHTCTPFEITDEWPKYHGSDFGESNTAAVFLTMNPETEECFLYRDYVDGKKDVDKHIEAWRGPHPEPARRWASNWDFDRAVGGAPSENSWREQYADEGFFIEEPPMRGPGAVELGIERVYALFAGRALNGRPKLQIFADCEEIIKDLQQYSREIDPETGDVKAGTIKDKNKWHRLDALRYICQVLRYNAEEGQSRTGGHAALDEHYSSHASEMRDSILRNSERTVVGNSDSGEVWEATIISSSRTGSEYGLPNPAGMGALPPPTLLTLPW